MPLIGQTIADEFFEFDHFMGLALNGLNSSHIKNDQL